MSAENPPKGGNVKDKNKTPEVNDLLRDAINAAEEAQEKESVADTNGATDSVNASQAEKKDETQRESQETVENEKQENIKDESSSESKDSDETLSVRYMRLQADFQNFRRRSEQEQINTVRYANERLILQLLDVVDNFERALATEKEHDTFFEGMEMIHAQLREILTKNGVEAVEADGEAFDPNLHHAILTEESDTVEEGHVIETLQKGYKLNGKLIRPAMVKVAK